MIFDIPNDYIQQLTTNIGDLQSIVIALDDDNFGYCIKNMSIQISHDIFQFSSDEYFGNGIILSSKCDYSFRYLSDDLPLIPCNDDYLELYTYQTRGIYILDIHTCISDGSDMTASNMKDNVFAVMMGKQKGQNEYLTTDVQFLDHFKAGTLNFESLGHLIAGNVIIGNDASNAIYSLNIEGTLIGIKLESVDYINYPFDGTESLTIQIDDDSSTTITIEGSKVLDNGRYLFIFFEIDDWKILTSNIEIMVYSFIPQNCYVRGDCNSGYVDRTNDNYNIWACGSNCIGGKYYTNGVCGCACIQDINGDGCFDINTPGMKTIEGMNVNIYGIFEGFEDLYQLSFTVETDDSGLNNNYWYVANEKCLDKYGTQLTSIHSEDEDFLMNGFLGNTEKAHIGYFDLTLESQNNWLWIDGSQVDYENWAIGEPNNFNQEDCGTIYADGWYDQGCTTSYDKYLCSSPYWNSNTNRKFEINTDLNIDDIILISIGNNHQSDKLCIDSISINDQSVVHISNNWLGGSDHSPSSLMALFQYPVCKTEVVGMTIDYDNSASSIIDGDSSIAGLDCINSNRLISSTCSISQSFELSSTTSFSISNSDSKTNEFSWGSSSALTLGTSSTSSTSTSNEFSFGFSQEISVGASVTAGVGFGPFNAEATINTEVSVGSNQQFTQSTENTRSRERSSEVTQETNEQNTESSTITQEFESQYETTETTTIECNAEIDVPPSHSVQYSLIFSAVDTIIKTYTDLKLTLCSAFINPSSSSANDEDNFIFIDNIPGIIKKKETRACTVNFEPANYLRNDITCDSEQQLAISLGSNYIPKCQSGNYTLYDGCQCDIGDSRTLGVCWCSDEYGNKLHSKTIQIRDGQSEEQVCLEILECDNTE